jgi:hypothetical protein
VHGRGAGADERLEAVDDPRRRSGACAGHWPR